VGSVYVNRKNLIKAHQVCQTFGNDQCEHSEYRLHLNNSYSTCLACCNKTYPL